MSATDYYVSASGADSNNGLSSSSPWETIEKVNSSFSLFKPGDRILFNRGDTFYGTIIVAGSGSDGNPIKIGAYGTGKSPVISGFATISGWTSEGNGIYSKVISPESAPNVVTVDGVNTAMGRFPDDTWLTIDSHDTNVSITDAGLQDANITNWTGAELVMRKKQYIIDRNPITNHTGHTLTYSSSARERNTSTLKADGWGYFIQNDIKTLTKLGEWYYGGGKFYMYFGAINPTTKTVRVSITDKLLDLNSRSYITIENIAFEGANTYANNMAGSSYVNIEDCSFEFTGNAAIFGVATDPYADRYYTINNNRINHSNNNAIYLEGNDNVIISGNTILNTGVIVGMGWSSMAAYQALFVKSSQVSYSSTSSAVIQYNNIINTGYVAIEFQGNNATVKNNYIKNFCFNKSDGGAIYTYDQYSNRVITENIIIESLGAPGGLGQKKNHSHGIYLDEMSTDVIISYNTIANINGSGVFLSSADFITVNYNTIFNCGFGEYITEGPQIFMVHYGGRDDFDLHDITITHNKLIAKSLEQYCLLHESIHDDLKSFGSIDYNYYARPLNNTNLFLNRVFGSPALDHTFTEWQALLGQDANSHKSDLVTNDTANFFRLIYNTTLSDSIVRLDVPMIDIEGTKYSRISLIPSYRSLVLMVDPNPDTIDANLEIFYLFPNPNDGHFSIIFIEPLQEKHIITISDFSGRIVYNGTMLKGESFKEFDLSYIGSGSYVLMIDNDEMRYAKKIIIK